MYVNDAPRGLRGRNSLGQFQLHAQPHPHPASTEILFDSDEISPVETDEMVGPEGVIFEQPSFAHSKASGMSPGGGFIPPGGDGGAGGGGGGAGPGGGPGGPGGGGIPPDLTAAMDSFSASEGIPPMTGGGDDGGIPPGFPSDVPGFGGGDDPDFPGIPMDAYGFPDVPTSPFEQVPPFDAPVPVPEDEEEEPVPSVVFEVPDVVDVPEMPKEEEEEPPPPPPAPMVVAPPPPPRRECCPPACTRVIAKALRRVAEEIENETCETPMGTPVYSPEFGFPPDGPDEPPRRPPNGNGRPPGVPKEPPGVPDVPGIPDGPVRPPPFTPMRTPPVFAPVETPSKFRPGRPEVVTRQPVATVTPMTIQRGAATVTPRGTREKAVTVTPMTIQRPPVATVSAKRGNIRVMETGPWSAYAQMMGF